MTNQARVNLNQQKLAGCKVDYLSSFREKRESEERSDYSKPLDWAKYIQKSLVNQIKPTRHRTYLSHQSFNSGGIKLTSEQNFQPSKTPQKQKTRAKCDFLKYELIDQCKELIKYLTVIQEFCYVCETEHIDKQGIKVKKRFYVDKEGRDLFDI